MVIAAGHNEIMDEIAQLPVLSSSAQLMWHSRPVLTFIALTDLSFQFPWQRSAKGEYKN